MQSYVPIRTSELGYCLEGAIENAGLIPEGWEDKVEVDENAETPAKSPKKKSKKKKVEPAAEEETS